MIKALPVRSTRKGFQRFKSVCSLMKLRCCDVLFKMLYLTERCMEEYGSDNENSSDLQLLLYCCTDEWFVDNIRNCPKVTICKRRHILHLEMMKPQAYTNGAGGSSFNSQCKNGWACFPYKNTVTFRLRLTNVLSIERSDTMGFYFLSLQCFLL